MGNRIMVNMAKVDTIELAQKTGIPTEDVEIVVKQIITDRNNNRRKPKPSPPEGSISILAASRKYDIPHGTISRWVKKGLIPILLETRNWLYVDEVKLAEVIQRYKQNPGQGKKTIKP